MDSVVHIRIRNKKKSTGIKKSTDSPYFNEYFVFEFNTTLQQLMDESLILTVIQPRKIWRPRRIIGYFRLDIATIWLAPDHQFYHKWVIINTGASDRKPGPRGYIKLNLGIITKGEKPKFPVISENTDDIERNLLMPIKQSHDRCRANFIFSVYNAEEIPKIESGDLPSTYIQISFAGLTGKTSVRKSTQNPVWNEKIVFNEYFPTLSERIKIELIYVQRIPTIVHFIYLKSICTDGENGFLPTFGPSYIYLYSSEKSEINYNGKLLLEMKTEILTDLMWPANAIEVFQIHQIPNLNLWNIEPVLLFCNIFSATMINKHLSNKPMSFEITMGGRVEENPYTLAENKSTSMKPVQDKDKLYSYLLFEDQVICLSILLNLDDIRFRIYNINILQKICVLLKMDLNKIEELFDNNYKKHKEQIESLYLNVAEKVEKKCRLYNNLVKKYPESKVNLDRKKMKLCIREIEEIERNISVIVHYKKRKKIFRKLVNVFYIIDSLIDDIQICWPDIFIWILSGNKRVGYYRIQSNEVIYSTNYEEKGILCGTFQNIYIQRTNKTKEDRNVILCKLTVQLWLGLNKNKKQCLEIVSNYLQPLEISTKCEIPTKFIWKEFQICTCNVYLYQGKFEPGADRSGLSDPFVQVVFNEHVLKSQMIPKTVHPVWNETLTFKNVTLYGSVEFLTKEIPIIILEVYDHDIHNIGLTTSNEFVGRCKVVPELQFDVKNQKVQKLQWIQVNNGDRISGELLTCAELILESTDDVSKSSIIYEGITFDSIPDSIKPSMRSYRLDVYFWGVHDLKKLNLQKISKPKVTIECAGTTIHSTTIQNTAKFLNFQKPCQFIIVTLPDNEEYYPPLSINMFDYRGFGYHIYVGTYLAKLQDFVFVPLTNAERNEKLAKETFSESNITESSEETESSLLELQSKPSFMSIAKQKMITNLNIVHTFSKQLGVNIKKSKQLTFADKQHKTDLETIDWWTKYYLSIQVNSEMYKNNNFVEQLKIKIYPSELEFVEEFHNFHDLLKTFKLYRGKRTGDEVLDEDNIIATFRCAIRIFKWPLYPNIPDDCVTETGYLLKDGAFQHYPRNDPVSFVARVYVIRAFNLRPKDLSGKSDPYLCVKLGDNKIVDIENYVPNDVNPVFGRCFEMKGTFPKDHLLTITVWDWDVSTADDLIGETIINLENRLYTNHRANCGLSKMYIQKGPGAWRDQQKPSQILQILCRRNKIDEPQYFENAIKVGPKIFTNPEAVNPDKQVQKEILSLLALHGWKYIPLVGCVLVPEHLETRSLYHYSKPGIEQGKLQLWVDIFPSGDFPPPPPVDVKPRVPIPYQLRAIVWNTDNVILDEDDFFTGERKSDIYVKGWITDPDDYQCTDVHYHSMSGEGNFNWRFIFPFLYLPTEDKVVIKKSGIFSIGVTTQKLPCFLNLQVWDNDTFNPDDFLGSVKLSLTRLPRGAKNSKLCSLKMLKPGVPTINLFKTKRHKGWWPFEGKDKKGKNILAGKVEIELEILTEYEYSTCPAGLGRSEPQALPKPKRPEMTFFGFRNPLKLLKYLICRRFRNKILLFLLILLLIFMGLVAIYSFPKYLVKRLLGA